MTDTEVKSTALTTTTPEVENKHDEYDTVLDIMDCFDEVREITKKDEEKAQKGESNIIDPTKKIATSLKNSDKKLFSGEDSRGNYWAAAYIPTKDVLFVMLRDKRTSENFHTIVKEGENDKLYKFFDDVYQDEREEKATHNTDQLGESCSAGSTCAGCVATIPNVIGKTVKRKKAKRQPKVSEGFDVKLFKESILNDLPTESFINGYFMKYFINEGKNYLSVDNSLVKTYDKNEMLRTIDELADGLPVTTSLLEDYSCYEMDILMEDGDTEETVDPTLIAAGVDTPNESKELLQKAENDLKSKSVKSKVDVSGNTDEEVLRNQEYLAYDPENHTAVTQDPLTKKIKVSPVTAIKDIK